jgi:hypothetical protein
MRLAALLVALALARGAAAYDRVAVELLPGESPEAALFAFDEACMRHGLPVQAAPAQTFEFEGARFLRLDVDGPPYVVRCLDELVPPRRGVDGSIAWFDGQAAGVVVPRDREPRAVPDSVWYDTERAWPSAPRDAKLLERLASGDTEALDDLFGKQALEALTLTVELTGTATARAQVALSAIATSALHWRVRAQAIAALPPLLSRETLSGLARDEPDWHVRYAAVLALGRIADGGGLPGVPQDEAVEELIVARALADAAPEVRRAALAQLTSAAVGRHLTTLGERTRVDPDARVRAASLETLVGSGLVARKIVRQALGDAAPQVRMAAVSGLLAAFEPGDAPALWTAMNAPERGIRLAAAPLLDRIDDGTIGRAVWNLLLEEANQLDSDGVTLRTYADFLQRHPFDGLATVVGERLKSQLAPHERRLMGRLFAGVAVDDGRQLFEPMMDSSDPELRALAAEVAPPGERADRTRLRLLSDVDEGVRAAALLGLCQPGSSRRPEIDAVELGPSPLAYEAMLRRQVCGERLQQGGLATNLGDEEPSAPVQHHGRWPSLAALAILLSSVLASRLSKER